MAFNIGWPEGIYLALNLISLPLLAAGSADNGRKSATAAMTIAMWLFLTLPLLYWGGFFA